MSSNSTRSKPSYFDEIAQKARQRWKQLEADPELAGPWHQLFSQVQSPRHVLSELLQNADDAGAKSVFVRIENGHFIFEHDGNDFEKEEFASLCRFGYSNKRNLHTIGFRGIGFKSTFSLGDYVDVFSPTLAVRFEKDRFTRPRWIENAQEVGKRTVFRVKISDERRAKELEKNFDDWIGSPASLLFFANVCNLEIQGTQISRQPIESGPCNGSRWFNLVGAETNRVLVVKSPPEEFPPDSVAEIKKERNASDLHLPPCQIDIVFGLDSEQKVYVVLPTGVRPDLPFSINGPFLQDPARFGIKDPSTSPTNRWLLERAGKLAGESMHSILVDAAKSGEERANAYSFLPSPADTGDSLDKSVTYDVVESFRFSIVDKPLLLNDKNELSKLGTCTAFSSSLHDVWPATVLKNIFCSEFTRALSSDVSEKHRRLLSKWGWVKQIEVVEILKRLQECRPPRPRNWASLSRLWEFVADAKRSMFHRYDFGTLNIAPAQGHDFLMRPEDLVRLSTRQSTFSPNDFEFLTARVNIVESEWIEFLSVSAKEAESSSANPQTKTPIESSIALLKVLGLESPSTTEDILICADEAIGRDWSQFESRKRVAHIFAATDTQVPREYEFHVRDRSLVSTDCGVLVDADGILEEVLPECEIRSRVIHDAYNESTDSCSESKWQRWLISDKSRLLTLPPFEEFDRDFATRIGLEEFLTSRNVSKPTDYQYRGRASYGIVDKRLLPSLVDHLAVQESDDSYAWTSFMDLFFKGSSSQWVGETTVRVMEHSSTGPYKKRAKCDPVPAEWITQLAERPCLLDTFNRPCLPSELLLRTPQTEPLMGVEAFIKTEYDTPENRPLLEALGCRSTPAGPEKLLARIKALSGLEHPPIHELAKWYEAVDKVVARSSVSEISELQSEFGNATLVYTQSGEWAKVTEVFRFVDDEGMPGAPTIHPAISDLMMWSRLGVADRPTPELVIAWLNTLPTDKRLDPATKRRVKGCLQTFPDRIWNECGHWLSLDDRWTEVNSFHFSSTQDRVIRISDLFAGVQAKTADLRNLTEADHSKPFFSALRDVGQCLEMRLTESIESNRPAATKTWTKHLGKMLSQIAISDDPEKETTVRHEGQRLAGSTWRAMQSLRTTPYIDGEPAGHAIDAEVVWLDCELYVLDRSFVSIYRQLVDEMSRPFGLQSIADAIRSCADRSDGFIEEYIQHHFELAEQKVVEPAQTSNSEQGGSWASNGDSGSASPAPDENQKNTAADSTEQNRTPDLDDSVHPIDGCPSPARSETEAEQNESKGVEKDGSASVYDDRQTDQTDLASTIADGDSNDVEGTDEDARETEGLTDLFPSQSASPTEKPKPSKAPLIERFAALVGFSWVIRNQLATSNDSLELRKSTGLFPWQINSASGMISHRLWVTPQSLAEGVEMPAEIWNVVKQSPHDCAFVFEDNRGYPVKILGDQMMNYFKLGQVRLFPSKYRLHQESELENQK
ncbi:ATP-binding protein [Pirellulaceae bacterium]|nr:ATP-binding protein [Pirellulaceae bacterium]